MTIDSVRRMSGDPSPAERGEQIESGELKLELCSEEPKQQYVPDEEYPLAEPRVLNGSYSYESEPLFGSPTTAEGEIQIRRHSNLILIESEGVPKAKHILNSLAKAFESESAEEFTSDFRPHTESIMDFVERADTMVHARVLDHKGKVTEIEDRDDERLSTYPIERIKLIFRKTIDGEEQEAVVTYSDDEVQFREGEGAIREYVIQHFEAAFSDDA